MEEGKDKKPLRSKYTKEEKAYNEEIVNSLREQNMLLSDQVNLRKEAKSLAEDLLTDAKEKLEMDNDIVRKEDDLTKKITEGRTREKDLVFEINQAKKSGNTDAAGILSELLQDQQNLNGATQQELVDRQIINDELGVMDNLMNALEDIPFLNEFIEGDEAIQAMEDSIIEGGTALEGLLGYAKDNAKEFGLLAGKAFLLTQALSVGPFLMKSMMEVSEQTSKFSKDLGLSANDALTLRTRMGLIAQDAGSMAVTTADTTEAFNNLNAQFGTASTMLRSDIVMEMARLNELTGMSAESQGRFASMAMRTGKNAAVITKEARAAVVAGEQERGVRLDINKVLDEAGQVTGVIAANMGYNVTAIAKSIAVAKQFGVTLQDLAGISSNLLDFNSSIESELQAELYTGKQLNLEKARLAALTGDYQTLTKEIMNNVGSETEFAQMNVIAKEKMAAALGMSVDRMSDLVYQNANLAELAQEARDRGEDELADSLEKRNVQQQLTDLQEKMADIAVTYLAPALDVVAGIIGYMADNSFVLYGVLGLMGALKLGGIITSVLGLAGALTSAGVAGAGVASALTLGIGAVAIAGGIALIVNSMSKARDQEMAAIQDGIIEPGGGLVVSGPKGSISLDPNDSIIAGTNLGGGGKNSEEHNKKQLMLLQKIHDATVASAFGGVGVIAYSAFNAVKKDKHYETKFR